MRSMMLLSALAVGLTSLNAFAADSKPATETKPAASGYTSLLPTEKDLEKSTAAAEAKAKADKEKAQRTGGAPAIPKTKSKVSLTANCKDSAGKTYAHTDPGYDACIQAAQIAAQQRREIPPTKDSSSGTGTSTEPTTGAGFNFKIGD